MYHGFCSMCLYDSHVAILFLTILSGMNVEGNTLEILGLRSDREAVRELQSGETCPLLPWVYLLLKSFRVGFSPTEWQRTQNNWPNSRHCGFWSASMIGWKDLGNRRQNEKVGEPTERLHKRLPLKYRSNQVQKYLFLISFQCYVRNIVNNRWNEVCQKRSLTTYMYGNRNEKVLILAVKLPHYITHLVYNTVTDL